MKFILLLAGFEAVTGAILDARQAACNQNNCYRAVSRHTPSSDCATFLSSSTTLPPSDVITKSPLPTTTLIVTTISTVFFIVGSGVVHNKREEPSAFAKREAIPGPVTLAPRSAAPTPTIPSYASACSSSLAFASACSCLGYTETVKTITLAPTVTSTYVAIKEVYTATTTLAVCDPADEYGLIYQGGYFPNSGPMNPGPYGYPINNNYGTYFYLDPSNTTIQDLCVTCFETLGCTCYSFVNYTAQPDLYIVSQFSGQTDSATQYYPGGRETLLYDYVGPNYYAGGDGIGPCSDAYQGVNNVNCYSQAP